METVTNLIFLGSSVTADGDCIHKIKRHLLLGRKAMTNLDRQHIKKQLLLLLSHVSCVQLCATPQMAAHQAPPSMGFSREEYWSGLPLPSPIKKQRHYFTDKGPSSQSYGFPSSHVWM